MEVSRSVALGERRKIAAKGNMSDASVTLGLLGLRSIVTIAVLCWDISNFIRQSTHSKKLLFQ
jgi:hypothetical protein